MVEEKMSGEIEDIRAPLLKLYMVIFYVLWIIFFLEAIITAGMIIPNIALSDEINPRLVWGVIINTALGAHAFFSSRAINNLTYKMNLFINGGFISAIAVVIIIGVLDLDFFIFIDLFVPRYIVTPVYVGFCILGILAVYKNRKEFVND
ncbi:MAG: hypothetical protein GY870_18340 [archaeon]|nr:hypothetical protein [archaeon]